MSKNKKNQTIKIPDLYYVRGNLPNDTRTIEVVECFGYLDSQAPHRVITEVCDAFEFDMGMLNVIVGYSGSGKSTLLRKIRDIFEGEFLISAPNESNESLINLVGESTQEAIEILSATGLGEGNLFLRKFSELSEGQKFRMRLALEISKKSKSVLFIDEFGSKLDKKTACALAYSFSKLLRRKNRQCVICCNDQEIADALNPDTLIRLNLDNSVSVIYPANKSKRPQIEILKGTKDDYISFKKYHYLDYDGDIESCKVMIATQGNEQVGIVMIRPPISAKREIQHHFFKQINKMMGTIHRIIVSPEYRGLGISKQMAMAAFDLYDLDILEIRSAMFHYVPYPLSWGFVQCEFTQFCELPSYLKLEEYLIKHGINSHKTIFKNYSEKIISKLNRAELEWHIKKEEDEKHTNQLLYYIEILKQCGVKCPYDINELIKLYVSPDRLHKSDEELVVSLIKHRQSVDGAYYYHKNQERN